MAESEEVKVIKTRPVGETQGGQAMDIEGLIQGADEVAFQYNFDVQCQIPAACSGMCEGLKLCFGCSPFIKDYVFSGPGGAQMARLKENYVPKCLNCGVTEWFEKLEQAPGVVDFPRDDYSFKIDFRTAFCPCLCRPTYRAYAKGGRVVGIFKPCCFSCIPSFDVYDPEEHSIFTVSTGCMELFCFNLLCCSHLEINWPIKDTTGQPVGNINWKIDNYNSCCCNGMQLASKANIACTIKFPQGIDTDKKITLLSLAQIIENTMFTAKVKGSQFNHENI